MQKRKWIVLETKKLEIARCHLGGFGKNIGYVLSHNPPGAYYTAQGPQKHPEILKDLLYM